MTTIPPPPGFPEVPPPEPEGDMLKRRKRLSWKEFGGEGFLVSVAFHLMLLVAGLFWAIRELKPPAEKTPPRIDLAGGRKGADSAKSAESPVRRTPPMTVKTPSHIVSKKVGAEVTLPAAPAPGATSFAGELSSGGIKGAGLGERGGPGPGSGPGNVKGFTGIFGLRGLNAPGISGTFYDAKQTPDGKPTRYAPAAASGEFADEVLRPLIRHWDPARHEDRFFKAPDRLNASQIFIPTSPADGAPAAYGVGGRVKPSRWFAWYRGTVVAPKTGKFRFWGLGDDALVVRWDKRLALDAGWSILSQGKGEANHGAFAGKPVLGVSETKKGNPGALFRAGPWFEAVRGRDYPIEILISEIPGGACGAWLLMEEADSTGKPDGALFLFRMSGEPLPSGIRQDTGLDIDMTGKGLFWNARPAKTGSPR